MVRDTRGDDGAAVKVKLTVSVSFVSSVIVKTACCFHNNLFSLHLLQMGQEEGKSLFL
jgi:hypothetical protein